MTNQRPVLRVDQLSLQPDNPRLAGDGKTWTERYLLAIACHVGSRLELREAETAREINDEFMTLHVKYFSNSQHLSSLSFRGPFNKNTSHGRSIVSLLMDFEVTAIKGAASHVTLPRDSLTDQSEASVRGP